MASGLDPAYVALLGLADAFLNKTSPDVKNGVKCLMAIFKIEPEISPALQAKTHLQLGRVLREKTLNQDLAKNHVELSWYQSQKLPQIDPDVCFEAACLLSEIFESEGQINNVKQILQKAIEMSRNFPYWHCRLLFQLASASVNVKDFASAVSVLGAGVDFAYMAGASYTRLLFLLSKTMILLQERKFSEANPLLHQAGPLIENWVLQNTHQKESVAKQQKEYLQIYYLVLQVCYYLMVGQVKSVKTVLKQLQQSIQTITSPGWPPDEEMISTNPADNFQWLPKDHLCILVYLVTVMHSMQAGYMDKAQKYTDKAIVQIQKLQSVESRPLLSTFHVLLLEHIIQCRLVTGNKAGAIEELGNLCRILEGNPLLMQKHRPQLHTLLGLYAMSMNHNDWAEVQLREALRTSQERELWTFANLNLAILYLRSGRESDFMALLDRISPDHLPSQSHSLQASAYYVQGLRAFFSSSFNEAKRYLRETLKMANAEDLNRLTSCSLVLLGHIFLSMGSTPEAMNMVEPAMQLASKIPDVHAQLWASTILKDLYSITGDRNRSQEGERMHETFTQNLLQDHFNASKSPDHNLIQWTDGPFPLSVHQNNDSEKNNTSANHSGDNGAQMTNSAPSSSGASGVAHFESMPSTSAGLNHNQY